MTPQDKSLRFYAVVLIYAAAFDPTGLHVPNNVIGIRNVRQDPA